MNGRSLCVEFLGLPGVGKSSLSRRVAEILCARGLPVSEPTYRLDHGPGRVERTLRKSAFVLREALFHPGYAALSARAFKGSGQQSAAVFFKMLFNWLLVSALLRRRPPLASILLFDQGIFQALWSVGLGARGGALGPLGGHLAGHVPVPDLVTVVEADLATVKQRLSARSSRDSRADHWGDDEAAMFARSCTLLEEAKALPRTLESRPGAIRTIHVRNETNSDMEQAAALLAADIERIFKGEKS